MNQKHKVLIIKVGYSETLEHEISTATSYGDVIRSTVLLNLYKDEHVTWLVDEKAFPILKNNPLIHRILIYNLTNVLQLQSEHFDTVINLEKVPGLCALADSIKAWRRYGFRFDVREGLAEAYDGTHIVLSICQDIEKKRKRKASWQEGLFEMVGAEWKKQKYVFSYSPTSSEKYDIGFNYQVGNKWPLKAWPDVYWKELEKLISSKYTVSWQEGLNSMEDYFEWISNCRLVVTNDSFGMHLAIALNKKIVALFGPTHYCENYFYGLGIKMFPQNFSCEKFPCYDKKCAYFDDSCMRLIKPEDVLREITRLFNSQIVEDED
ncbi:MAG: glycosyltransferase family 9 protein [Candidatus Riflebacteria bacterium]|nr:glycosyltransferase family 9 protein [Candidatus Riflebacteria bacterium]